MNFNQDVTARLMELERQVDRLKVRQSQSPMALAIGLYQGLPGLVGFWPMSSVQRSTGSVYDLSEQGRTLSYNGNPTFNLYNGLVPYIDFDGTGDYLSRADETDLDILGSEAIFASPMRGLTMGGWFWFNTLVASTSYGMMSKYVATGSQISYGLWRRGTGNAIGFAVSNNGSSTVIVDSISPITNQWYFAVARYIPSTSLALFVNGSSYLNTTSIPSSIFNSTSPFEIGRIDATLTLAGRASLCFLCANALPDILISEIFQQTRSLFGV